ncbi:AraC family transcriptional regulator [Amphritea sp. HPY]|uniref:AraC family transcriptional regulator n=1 Tax=Amphritea sp. HPY TaxID=3421652 RepID=UPI003D7D02F0
MADSQQFSRINDVLHVIHRDISAELTGASLARVAAYSEQHFHRTFHKVIGETLHGYIRRIRMEHAANLLMFDEQSPVAEIAEQCGYRSLSSFSKVFRNDFGMTPGQWRRRDCNLGVAPYLKDPEVAAGYQRISESELPRVELINRPAQRVAYVRHLGYGREIRQAWQILQAWAATEQRSFTTQIGLHHSNPAWVPLEQCRYVACIGIDTPLQRRGVVNSMTIPGGLHAQFHFSGCYGELLPWISKVLDQWLPQSGLKVKSTPAFVEYQRNHFLDKEERFELHYYLPVSLY